MHTITPVNADEHEFLYTITHRLHQSIESDMGAPFWEMCALGGAAINADTMRIIILHTSVCFSLWGAKDVHPIRHILMLSSPIATVRHLFTGSLIATVDDELPMIPTTFTFND